MHAPPSTPYLEKVALVTEWILAGMRASQVPQQIRSHLDRWPGNAEPSTAEVLDLVGAAHELLLRDTTIDVARENAKAVARLNYLYAKSCAIQDYKGAASIQKELNQVVARVVMARAMERGAP